MSDSGTRTTPVSSWTVPGVAFEPAPEGLPGDVLTLDRAVDGVLDVAPAALSPQVAVARAERLLAAAERVTAAALRAVADVEARDLWALRAAGSTRGWLRTLPCGDHGQAALARLLQDRPALTSALAAGEVSARTAAVVARELVRVPGHVAADQLTGVLLDGLGDLLGVWAGAACLDPTPAQETEFDRRREQLTAVVQQGLADCWSDAAGQLEPAFVLAAQVLAPTEVQAGLRLLVDALQPEADADALAEKEYRSRSLVLRQLRDGGWSLRAHLTDETEQLLLDALRAREQRHPLTEQLSAPAQPEQPGGITVEDVFARPADTHDASEDEGRDTQDADPAPADAPADADAPAEAGAPAPQDPDPFGAAGPGAPPSTSGREVEGTPLPAKDQRAHDAFTRMLTDLWAVRPGRGVPAPSSLTFLSSIGALDGLPGAPPGRLVTAHGEVTLAPSRVRRHACTSVLSAVLTDALGRPVGASGTHRHASRRERRAMRAAWGSTCGVNGCALPGPVPHHAEPWWKTLVTALKDLVPLCEHHHHDVHDGHKTLRLRDGRRLDEWGWVR